MEEKRYIKRKEKASIDGNKEQLALSCKHLGDHYNQLGKYQNAVQEYQQEAEIYAKMGKQLEMARAHRMIGEMFMQLGEFDNAKEYINVYLKTVKKLQNRVEEQRAHATLGRAYLMHGQSLQDISATNAVEQLKQAEKSFLRSLLLVKELTGQISKLEQLDMQARCYLNIGVVKEHMENFEESVAYIDKAIKISKTHDIFELTHLCYISMSLLYQCKKHDSTLALRFCNMALQVAKRLPNKVKKICETLITKSEILIKEGDFASAKQILTKAYKKNTPDENDKLAIEKSLRVVVKICQILDELVTVSSLDYAKRKALYEKLGDGCCHLLVYNKALEYYHKMLESAELNGETGKDFIPIYVSLYQTYKDNGQHEKALEYLWKEYELNKDVPKEAFNTLCSIADICELQKQSFWTIKDIYEKARAEAAKAGSKQAKLEKIVLTRLWKLHMQHDMHVLAEALQEDAKSKDIDLAAAAEESDAESDTALTDEQNTPALGDDVCLSDLTDSDMSDLDETEKPRAHRATRGTRCLTIKRNNKGETQLHQACIAGNLELARRLLDQGHVVNVRDHAGWIPLHEAANHGFCDIVELLLDRGAVVAINDKGGTSCDGITPLYDACTNGFLDVVELLLERGADATVKTDFGETCVNALDKWREKAKLTDGEQAHYEKVRAELLRPLAKLGIGKHAKLVPLTNANHAEEELSNDANYADDTNDDDDDGQAQDEIDAMCMRSSRRSSNHNRSSDGSKVLKDCNKRSPHQRATLEYKNVMSKVKHPHRSGSTIDDDDFCPAFASTSSSLQLASKQKRSGLLHNNEVDADSWLIDDVGPEKKKRRFRTPTKDARNVARSSNLHDSANATWELETTMSEIDAFQMLLDAPQTSTQQRQKHSKKLTLSRTSSMTSNSSVATTGSRNKPARQQTSLLDSGFCRFRSESPNISEDSNDAAPATAIGSMLSLREIEPDSTTSSIHLLISPSKSTPIHVQTAAILPSNISFKIKVENELLLVPIDTKKINDINMRWLAEEASRRYNNLVGLRPLLRLKTTDGFAYEENDAVSVAVEQSMILATVLEWKIEPLEQRYKDVCQQLNMEKNLQVLSVLDKAQLSNAISFANCWLTSEQTEPIFKAVMHQTSLRVLDLSNNFMQNEGCQQLAKSMSTLKQLKILNLKGNFITCEGLEALLGFERNAESVGELEELNLSQNPLGNSCMRLLDKFCNSAAAKSLQHLLLSNCNLSNFYDFDLCFYQLSSFDISFNTLSDDCLRKVLSKLNACRMQCLNLSYSSAAQLDERAALANAERIVEFFESGTCEKFKSVALAGCRLSDANMYKIVQCLGKANNLESLNICGNSKLNAFTLNLLLDNLPQLQQVLATNCAGLIDALSIEKLSQMKNLPNLITLSLSESSAAAETATQQQNYKQDLSALWQAHWGDKAKLHACDNYIKLYVNDKDLFI